MQEWKSTWYRCWICSGFGISNNAVVHVTLDWNISVYQLTWLLWRIVISMFLSAWWFWCKCSHLQQQNQVRVNIVVWASQITMLTPSNVVYLKLYCSTRSHTRTSFMPSKNITFWLVLLTQTRKSVRIGIKLKLKKKIVLTQLLK